MTDPRIIIAVLSGAVIVLIAALAITIAAFKRALGAKDRQIATVDRACSYWFAEYKEASDRLAPFIAKRERHPVTKRFLPAVRREVA